MATGLKLSNAGSTSVYNISGAASLPSWLGEKKRAALRKDEDFRRRVELIQGLEFPVASGRVKLTPDGCFLVVTGIHPPMVKVFELGQLALKFERHLLSEVVDFQVLSDDYSKLAFACADRTLAFHARSGAHFSTRLPRAPRSLAYDPASATLLAGCSAGEVYRLSLDAGRFLAPLPSRSPGLNCVRVCPAHGLLAAAGDDGALECFDPRAPGAAVARLEGASGEPGVALTALRFDAAGLTLALGTAAGCVRLYDLRSSAPVGVKDHLNGGPVVDVKWLSDPQGRRRLVSADARAVKVWDAASREPLAAIEPEAEVTDLCVWPGSGLLVAATEAPRMAAFFVPALGPAPRWCSFLENLTEEMEEAAAPPLYDDYRFVTPAELARLGLASAVGTPLLRPYMHGYFIDARLHGKAAALAAPFDYGAYRAQRVAARLEAERASRITHQRRLPRVNAALAARLLATRDGGKGGGNGGGAGEEEAPQEAAAGGEDAAKGAPPAPVLLRDARFGALFSDPNFEVDEAAAEYRLLHPNAPPAAALLREHYAEDDGDGDGDGGGGGGGGGGSDAGGRGAAAAAGPRLYVARGAGAAAAFARRSSLAAERAQPLGERAAARGGRGAAGAPPRGRGAVGAAEAVFRDADGGDGGGAGAGMGRAPGRGRGRGRGRGGGGRGGAGRGRSGSAGRGRDRRPA